MILTQVQLIQILGRRVKWIAISKEGVDRTEQAPAERLGFRSPLEGAGISKIEFMNFEVMLHSL
jgi:hypothetical protein